ncbi:MAG: GAF domain-containing protein [Halanaeroarchaeum sp.]
MNRDLVPVAGLIALGGVLVGFYVVEWVGPGRTAVISTGPFLLIAGTVVYAGIWLARDETYLPQADRVLAWALGAGVTFAAVGVLVVLDHWPTVGFPGLLSRPVVDIFTAGSLAGTAVGLYDAQSQNRFAALEAERERIARFADKAGSLNRYAKVLNQSTHLTEVSALSLEVLDLLIESRAGAFVLVDAEGATIVDSTFGDEPGVLEEVALALAEQDPLSVLRCPDEVDCALPEEFPASQVLGVPVPAGEHVTAVLIAVPEAADEYTGEDIELLELLSAHLATALPDVDGSGERAAEP